MIHTRRRMMSAVVLLAAWAAGCGRGGATPPAASAGSPAFESRIEGAPPAAKGGAAATYHQNVLALAQQNDAFRRVLFTGPKTQLVVMSIPPGGSVGAEQHAHVEQVLFCASGQGRAVVNGVASRFGPGDVLVVTPGSVHDIVNDGKEPLKIYTVYAPPNHLPGRVQATRADAERDEADREFGHEVE